MSFFPDFRIPNPQDIESSGFFILRDLYPQEIPKNWHYLNFLKFKFRILYPQDYRSSIFDDRRFWILRTWYHTQSNTPRSHQLCQNKSSRLKGIPENREPKTRWWSGSSWPPWSSRSSWWPGRALSRQVHGGIILSEWGFPGDHFGRNRILNRKKNLKNVFVCRVQSSSQIARWDQGWSCAATTKRGSVALRWAKILSSDDSDWTSVISE